MPRRARWVGGGIILTAAVVYGLAGNPLDPFDNRRFSPDVWRAAGRYDRDERARMCRDIINRVVRPGMSEKQVVELLGPPERVRYQRGTGGDPIPDRRIYVQHWQLDISEDG